MKKNIVIILLLLIIIAFAGNLAWVEGKRLSERIEVPTIGFGRVTDYLKIIDYTNDPYASFSKQKWRPPYESFQNESTIFFIYKIPTRLDIEIIEGNHKLPTNWGGSMYIDFHDEIPNDTLKSDDVYELKIVTTANSKLYVKQNSDTISFCGSNSIALLRNNKEDMFFVMKRTKPTDTLKVALKKYPEGTYMVFMKNRR